MKTETENYACYCHLHLALHKVCVISFESEFIAGIVFQITQLTLCIIWRLVSDGIRAFNFNAKFTIAFTFKNLVWAAPNERPVSADKNPTL